MENKNQNDVNATGNTGVTEMERERIKALLKKHWNVNHPAYPSKLSYLFALIDGKQEEEEGCGKSFKISQLSNETFVCGKDHISGNVFMCDDCLRGAN